MTEPDDIDSYRKMIKAATPQNPRKEADIAAALRAYDAAFASPRRSIWPAWLRMPVVMGALVTAAAGFVAVAFLPQAPQMPLPVPASAPAPAPAPATPAPATPAPPDLRLALPQDPAPASDTAAARAMPVDEQVMAAFSGDLPQYFPLPWGKDLTLALLAGTQAKQGETPLFAADGRRLVVLRDKPESPASVTPDDAYQRFAIAFGGLGLLDAGEDLAQAADRSALLAQARAAAAGIPAREAAIAAISGE